MCDFGKCPRDWARCIGFWPAESFQRCPLVHFVARDTEVLRNSIQTTLGLVYSALALLYFLLFLSRREDLL